MTNNVIKSIKKSVENYRDKTALIYGEMKFTYNDIDIMSNKVCKYLNDLSIGKENVVAVYMDRSFLSIISVLGILKAGAAFLPIDIKTPLKRVDFMTDISKAKCIIWNSDDSKTMDELNIPSIDIHEVMEKYESVDRYNTDESIEANTLAYILFTSGTTGLPKGAMIENAGMLNHLEEKIRILNLSEKSVVVHNASISFDVSVWQMLSPLCVGATIVICTEKTVLNLRVFLNLLYEYKVNVLEVVPTYLSLLLDEMKNYPNKLTNLKYLISTGESLIKSLADRCFELLPDIFLVNAYGPTEASDDIMHCIIDKNSNFERIPIGTPIHNANITIVNTNGGLCGVNEPGELLVSGICVGRGYVGNEKETELCFLYDSPTHTRTYRTGDLVSLSDDGNYYFYDRIDMQIAFHGKRVEIKEIENTMLKYEGIYASAVVYEPNIQQINAYYVSNTDINVNDLKEFIKTLLPPHMIPVFIYKIDKLPVNISGKTDYKMLMNMGNSLTQDTSLEEYTEDDRKLLKIIMDVVGIKKLPDDNNWKNDIKTIGYNSINAIKLVLEIEAKYDIEIEEEILTSEILFNYDELKKVIYSYLPKSKDEEIIS